MNRTRNSHQNLVTNNATLNDEQKQLLPLQLDDDKLAANLDYQSVAHCEQLYRLSHDDRTDSFSMRSLESMPSTSTPQTEETKALWTNIHILDSHGIVRRWTALPERQCLPNVARKWNYLCGTSSSARLKTATFLVPVDWRLVQCPEHSIGRNSSTPKQ